MTILRSTATIFLLFATILCSGNLLGQTSGSGTIAFIRNGDVWLMNPDGTNQRPHVGGIQNAKGKISWEPGNKRYAFGRMGSIQLKYPDGGGGSHNCYDLFYAYIDSTNNYWEGFTETLGAQSPDWSADGSTIAFTYDHNANTANSMWPEYWVGFYDIKTRVVSSLKLPRGDNILFAMSPSLSPDLSSVAYSLASFDGKRVSQIGLVITATDEVVDTYDQLIQRAKKVSNASAPSWSPDGKWIAYVSSDLGNPGIYVISPDLSEKKLIYKPAQGIMVAGSPPSWSPDGKKFAFGSMNGAIYTVNVDGTGATMISGPGSDSFPAWSK
jgi:Tol biopolymer transport system component